MFCSHMSENWLLFLALKLSVVIVDNDIFNNYTFREVVITFLSIRDDLIGDAFNACELSKTANTHFTISPMLVCWLPCNSKRFNFHGMFQDDFLNINRHSNHFFFYVCIKICSKPICLLSKSKYKKKIYTLLLYERIGLGADSLKTI